MDPIETAAVRDDMERLHMVSREGVIQAAHALVRIAEETMRWRAEQARHALADDQAAAAAAAARFRAERDLAAATWEARLRDPSWFADAPVGEILQTWTSAEGWAQTGDARAAAACERLRLEVRRLGVDPDLAQGAIAARDVQALTDLLDAPEQDAPAAAVITRPDRAAETRPQAGHGNRGRGRGGDPRQATLEGADLQTMSELISASMHTTEAKAILADPNWPRVAAQLRRAQGRIDAFNTQNPSNKVDVPKLLGSLQFNRPAGELRTPAGWLIWQLHNATAARGVQLAAESHPDGHRVRTQRPATPRTRGRGRGTARDTSARRDPERGS